MYNIIVYKYIKDTINNNNLYEDYFLARPSKHFIKVVTYKNQNQNQFTSFKNLSSVKVKKYTILKQ